MPQVRGLGERYIRAVRLALDVHRSQLRKGTRIPYVAHVVSVSGMALENGGSEDAAIAGLLHDSIEDSDDGSAMDHRIRQEFGPQVATTVLRCSDAVAVPGRDKPPWRKRKEAYLNQLRGERDPDVLLVSACDKLHNARAIVADLRDIGDELWVRFNAPSSEQLWYYRSLVDAFLPHRHIRRVQLELERTVADMFRLSHATLS